MILDRSALMSNVWVHWLWIVTKKNWHKPRNPAPSEQQTLACTMLRSATVLHNSRSSPKLGLSGTKPSTSSPLKENLSTCINNLPKNPVTHAQINSCLLIVASRPLTSTCELVCRTFSEYLSLLSLSHIQSTLWNQNVFRDDHLGAFPCQRGHAIPECQTRWWYEHLRVWRWNFRSHGVWWRRRYANDESLDSRWREWDLFLTLHLDDRKKPTLPGQPRPTPPSTS